MKSTKKFQGIFYLLPMITVGFGLYVVENVWVAMLGYHFLAVLIVLYHNQGYQFKRIFVGGRVSLILFWALLAAISGIVLFGLCNYLDISDSLREGLSRMGLSGSGWLMFIVYYSLANPLIEEVYWRGFLGSENKEMTWSDIGYAAYHPLVFLKFLAAPWGMLEFVVLAAVGWLWRGMVKKHGGLLMPYIMHFSADLSIAVAIWILVRG